jgi:hypothetical protein
MSLTFYEATSKLFNAGIVAERCLNSPEKAKTLVYWNVIMIIIFMIHIRAISVTSIIMVKYTSVACIRAPIIISLN